MATTTADSARNHRKHSLRAVQSDIGLLKSYTIDSKGNMQFQAPATETGDSKGNFAKIATLKTVVGKKLRKKGVSFEPVRGAGKAKLTESLSLYPSPGMSVTPEIDKGPRRIYQKTEIQDGEKRIEILEIVECENSSNNNSARNASSSGGGGGEVGSRIPKPVSSRNPPQSTTSSSSTQQTPTTTATSNTEPPATTTTTSTAATTTGGGTAPATSSTATNSTLDNDTDQLISDMLIENLKTNNSVPEQPQMRRPPTIAPPKFTQMFEVIPEEKSSALSHDSTAEEAKSDKELGISSSNKNNNNNNTTQATSGPPKRLSAFTILEVGDVDEEDLAALTVPVMAPQPKGNVVKKGARPTHPTSIHNKEQNLPKAKQVREPPSIAGRTDKRKPGTQRVAVRGGGGGGQQKPQQKQEKKAQGNNYKNTNSGTLIAA